MIKRIAQNLLQNHASTSCILDDNINFVANYLNGKVIIDNERSLLGRSNSNDYNLMEAAVYYKLRRELNDRFMLVLATKNQRDLAWKFEILQMDGTFDMSNKKILLFTLLVLDELDDQEGFL
ncbi:hypothetical protein GLOIN_2v1777513 [Rhizophagus clarus]|uniref:MULE transposase domain-containing protein n=1 Tax=Rhizophagus clarus TaxID=94130 RepID=A0A8H3QVN5_9GLOM|nr:hypothetical protein GLOIN_2v1777513 [Rhizophagus clarus]